MILHYYTRYQRYSIFNAIHLALFFLVILARFTFDITFNENLFAISYLDRQLSSPQLLSMYLIFNYFIFITISTTEINSDVNTENSLLIFSLPYSRNYLLYSHFLGFLLFVIKFSFFNAIIFLLLFIGSDIFSLSFIVSTLLLPVGAIVLFLCCLFVTLISSNAVISILKVFFYYLMVSPFIFMAQKTDVFSSVDSATIDTIINKLVSILYFLLPNINGSFIAILNTYENGSMSNISFLEIFISVIGVSILSLFLINKKDF